MCACCPVGLLQKCCCYSYHQSQEQIACQNKPSNFRPTGRQLSERMQLGCLFLSSVECLQIKFLFLERGSQRSKKLWRIITTAFHYSTWSAGIFEWAHTQVHISKRCPLLPMQKESLTSFTQNQVGSGSDQSYGMGLMGWQQHGGGTEVLIWIQDSCHAFIKLWLTAVVPWHCR